MNPIKYTLKNYIYRVINNYINQGDILLGSYRFVIQLYFYVYDDFIDFVHCNLFNFHHKAYSTFGNSLLQKFGAKRILRGRLVVQK